MVLPASHRISRVPWYSGSQLKNFSFTYRTFTFCGWPFQTYLATFLLRLCCVRNPHKGNLHGFGLFPFRSPLLRESNIFFLFLGVLRCFSSPGLPSCNYLFHYMIHGVYSMWVSPFGNLRIKAYLRLPEAYRRLSRPSSAPGAKAFTLCSY